MHSLLEAYCLFVAESFPMYSGNTRRPGSRSVVTLTPCQDCQKRKVIQNRLPHTDSAKRSSPSLFRFRRPLELRDDRVRDSPGGNRDTRISRVYYFFRPRSSGTERDCSEEPATSLLATSLTPCRNSRGSFCVAARRGSSPPSARSECWSIDTMPGGCCWRVMPRT